MRGGFYLIKLSWLVKIKIGLFPSLFFLGGTLSEVVSKKNVSGVFGPFSCLTGQQCIQGDRGISSSKTCGWELMAMLTRLGVGGPLINS